MFDTPQHHTPDLETALDDLRQAMNDISFVAGVVVDLRRSATRLLSPLKDELISLRDRIDHVLPLLPVVALGTVLLTGCSGFVADFKQLEAFARAPKVEYGNPDAWRCDQWHSTTRAGAVEVCGLCQNISTLSQDVTMNGERFQVEPKGAVIRCSRPRLAARSHDAPATRGREALGGWPGPHVVRHGPILAGRTAGPRQGPS